MNQKPILRFHTCLLRQSFFSTHFRTFGSILFLHQDMAKKVKLNPFRITFQIIIGLLLIYLLIRPYLDKTYTADFEAYCPFGGLQAFSSFLVSNSLACSMTTTQIFMGLGLVIGVVLLSKLFCSYICPIGSFTEWLSRKGRKLKVNFEIKGLADRFLRVLKYALLFITFYFSVSSSELFCKTFDPYYAVFSGFSSDVVVSYAVMALLLAIPGSFFIRQFWCRYVCPLGAVSNIFTYSYIFGSITLLYVLLIAVFNVNLSWIWLLGTLTIAGLLLETFKVRILGFSLFKIKRNAESCTNCKLCDKVCPMSLKVSALEVVKDVDCHLCGDCVATCPEKDTLKISRFIPDSRDGESKRRTFLWIPAASVVVLIALGLAFSERIHIPTISRKWGNEQQMNSAGVFEMSGLASIKCFGSSMSFANHMKEVTGVLGIETYVGSHGVRVWYDKNALTDEDIKKAIFTPVKRIFTSPQNKDEVAVCEVGIDNFFDPKDAGLLSTRLSQNKGILAIQTQFGEPVHALIYYVPSLINTEIIRSLIEEKRVEWVIDGEEYAAKTDFTAVVIKDERIIPLKKYLENLYEPVSATFNSYSDFSEDQLQLISIPFNQAADPELTDMPWYLLSHLSNNRGIVSFETMPSESGFILELKIVKGRVTGQEVMKLLTADSLNVHLSDGTTQTLKNPYKF